MEDTVEHKPVKAPVLMGLVWQSAGLLSLPQFISRIHSVIRERENLPVWQRGGWGKQDPKAAKPGSAVLPESGPFPPEVPPLPPPQPPASTKPPHLPVGKPLAI